MTTKAMKYALASLAMTVGFATAQAQTPTATAPKAPAPQLSPTEQWIKDVKNPAPWFKWGADLRLRNEYLNNTMSLGANQQRSEQDVFRFRGRVWTTITPVENLSLNARLSAEPRDFMMPSFTGGNGRHSGMEWRYGIFDNLNIQWKEMFNQPLTLTVGRQDILLGDFYNWWLVADGTPGDGSWSFYLDAARLTLDLKDAKTKIDAFYIYQNAQPGEWIPTVGAARGYNGAPYSLMEQNEQGAILYISNKSIKNTQVDAYFMYKRDTAEFKYGFDSDLYTLGAKITGNVGEHVQYSLEGAYQFGNKSVALNSSLTQSQEQDVSAWGLNGKLNYLVKDDMKNQFRLSGEYLSGDDPSTSQNESFDLLWGRWPRWSELYIYSYIPEYGRVAQVGNVIRVGPGWSITPAKNLDFSADYFALFSDQKFSNASGVGLPPSAGFGTGTFRGHMLQTILKYKFSQHVSAHLWGEFIWMGDYYAQRDLMTFLRAELLFTF